RLLRGRGELQNRRRATTPARSPRGAPLHQRSSDEGRRSRRGRARGFQRVPRDPRGARERVSGRRARIPARRARRWLPAPYERDVDAGAVLKLLLDRDLVRVLGKKDEPGRPLIYGTTGNFLQFFGLKSLRDLPTLREFTELSDESKEVVERELGEVLPEGAH